MPLPVENTPALKVNLIVPTEEMREIGLSYFSYGLVTEGEVLYSYFTHQEWGTLYQEKRYKEIDPLLRGVIHSRFPLIVWDALHPCGKEKEIMAERNEICKIKSGLTVGLRKKGYTELIALGAESSPLEFYSLLKDKDYTRKIYDIVSRFYRTISQEAETPPV